MREMKRHGFVARGHRQRRLNNPGTMWMDIAMLILSDIIEDSYVKLAWVRKGSYTQ